MRKTSLMFHSLWLLFFSITACCSPSGRGGGGHVLENGTIRLEVTSHGGLRVTALAESGDLVLADGAGPSFWLLDTAGIRIAFAPEGYEEFTVADSLPLGPGKGLEVRMLAAGKGALADVTLRVRMVLYASQPGTVVCGASADGLGPAVLGQLRGLRLYVLDGTTGANLTDYRLFQGAAYDWGKWYTRIELAPGYHAANRYYQPNNSQPFDGGIPLNYLWSKQAGLALGQIDAAPRAMALPVDVDSGGKAVMALEIGREYLQVDADGHYAGLPVMLGVFRGDYYAPAKAYGELVRAGGLKFAVSPEVAFEPVWCTWGFRRNFTTADIYSNLPDLKRMEIPWVVVDDGWQRSFGAWPLDGRKFPDGEKDMVALVDSIHRAGLKAKLWWVPGHAQAPDSLYLEHPDWALLDRDEQPARSSWESIRLCPAYLPVIEQQRALVRKFLGEWGYDGFKMDGECLNAVPPCYNPAHNHDRPEESSEAFTGLFAMIQQEAEQLKPGCVLEVCACGLPQTVYTRAYYNQAVTSDPTSSDQVRARIKFWKALTGDSAAIYGDLVELSTGKDRGETYRDAHEPGMDFASSMALGGVIGTKYTTLEGDNVVRTWDNYKGIRSHWEKWFSLYNSLQLYKGRYLNLYDMAFDKPETHVIAKGDTLYYGMFAEQYQGSAELRGLAFGREYAVFGCESGEQLGGRFGGGPGVTIDCKINMHLLLRAVPLN